MLVLDDVDDDGDNVVELDKLEEPSVPVELVGLYVVVGVSVLLEGTFVVVG